MGAIQPFRLLLSRPGAAALGSVCLRTFSPDQYKYAQKAIYSTTGYAGCISGESQFGEDHFF